MIFFILHNLSLQSKAREKLIDLSDHDKLTSVFIGLVFYLVKNKSVIFFIDFDNEKIFTTQYQLVVYLCYIMTELNCLKGSFHFFLIYFKQLISKLQ